MYTKYMLPETTDAFTRARKFKLTCWYMTNTWRSRHIIYILGAVSAGFPLIRFGYLE